MIELGRSNWFEEMSLLQLFIKSASSPIYVLRDGLSWHQSFFSEKLLQVLNKADLDWITHVYARLLFTIVVVLQFYSFNKLPLVELQYLITWADLLLTKIFYF